MCGMDANLTQRVVTILREALPQLRLVYLFGSQARGDAQPSSDVDLAVLTPTPLPPMLRFDLQERLASAANRDVDLIDLQSASTVLRVQVIEGGAVIFEVNKEDRWQFETRCLSEYAYLNDERAGILADIQNRGTIYGAAPHG